MSAQFSSSVMSGAWRSDGSPPPLSELQVQQLPLPPTVQQVQQLPLPMELSPPEGSSSTALPISMYPSITSGYYGAPAWAHQPLPHQYLPQQQYAMAYGYPGYSGMATPGMTAMSHQAPPLAAPPVSAPAAYVLCGYTSDGQMILAPAPPMASISASAAAALLEKQADPPQTLPLQHQPQTLPLQHQPQPQPPQPPQHQPQPQPPQHQPQPQPPQHQPQTLPLQHQPQTLTPQHQPQPPLQHQQHPLQHPPQPPLQHQQHPSPQELQQEPASSFFPNPPMKAPDTKDKLAREHRQHDDRDRVVYSANRRESTSSSPSSYPHDGRRESTSSSPSSSYPQDGRREERRDTSSSYPYDGRREDRRDTSSSSYPFDGRREDRRDTSSSSYPYDGRREDRRDTSSSYPYDGRREERRDTSSSYPYDGRREDRRGSLYPYDSRRTDNYSYFDGPQEMPRREEQHRRDDRRWDSEQAATVAPFRGSSFPRDPREQKQHKKDWSQGNQHTFKPPIAATKRRTVQVKTNILSASVNVPPDCGFHQYHVEITPNVPFKYKHMIISAMFQKRLRCLGPNVRFVFNGDSQLFLVHKCGDDSSSGFQAKFEVMIGDGADARSINVSVVATFVKTIPMEDIVAFMRAQDFAPAQTDSPTEIISTYNTMLSHSHYVPGTNFFIRNALFSSKVTIPMDDIFSLWTGIRATLDLYKDGSAGVTISSCVTPVYHETNVLAFLKKSRRHIPWDRADDNFVHNEMYMRDLLTMLKGQRLATKHTKYNHRLYQVVGITPVPVQELAFVKEGTETHLVDYFKTTYDIDLTHTHLPALEMKSTSGNKVYMPLTLCSIPAGSRVMHLSDAEHGQIIKKSNMPPAAKLSQLEEIVRNLNLSEDETCKEFGLEVSSEFKQVTGTMLPMPTIFYKDTESMPRQGTWTTQKGDRMMKPCDVNAIVVFSMDRKLQPRAADDFIAGLVSMALDRGAFIQKPHIVKCRELDRNDFSFGNQETAGRAIEQKLPASLRSNSTLVFVFLADQDSTVYKTIKAVFSKLGVFSSCIQSRQLSGKKLEPVYNNLLSKFNFRCGGQNFAPVMSTTPKDGKMLLFAGEFIMLCGISIFVGGPSSPTFVVVSMACNPEATRYVTRSLLLPPKQTIIYGLKNIFIDLLKAIYMMFDHNKPTQIIVYRSGVSEHQIVNIQKSEVEDIRQACRDIQADGTYMPRIVFYGERSNHDVRMFPKNAQDADRSGNFAAGLVVDDPSVNKYPGDFFLVSQAGLQGVSCPPQYMHIHSWWPKETFSLELEKFQELTFSLCSQQNCQRFVSAPSPLSVATALCESLQAHYSVTSRNGVFGDLSHPDTLAAIQRDLAAHPDLEGTMYYF